MNAALTQQPIEWHKPSDKLPRHGQECVLMSPGGVLLGPIGWFASPEGGPWEGGMWVDLWATPQAGASYAVNIVALWTDWDAIKPPDALTDEVCK